MGSTVEKIDVAYPGNIIGISGLSGVLSKSGTLTSTPTCPNFTTLKPISAGLVKVALEPKQVGDMPRLIEGI